MTQFIRTSVGFLNLDHILLVRVGIEKEEGFDLVQMSDGRNVQCVIHDRVLFPEEPKPPEAESAKYDEWPKYDVEPVPETEV